MVTRQEYCRKIFGIGILLMGAAIAAFAARTVSLGDTLVYQQDSGPYYLSAICATIVDGCLVTGIVFATIAAADFRISKRRLAKYFDVDGLG